MERTPDEVKKGLGYHGWTLCDNDCPYGGFKGSGYDCSTELCGDALVLIQRLEAQNAELSGKIGRLQAERDAAVKSLRGRCFECKHNKTSVCLICSKDKELKYWQWRGVTKEE